MSSNPFDFCKLCGKEMPPSMHKRLKPFMCPNCHEMRRDGNYEVSKIFDELREKNKDLPEDDWSNQNVEVKDEPPLKNKRGATYIYSRNIIDDI